MTEQPDLPPSFNPGSYQRRSPRDQEKAETKRLGFIVLGIIGLLVVGALARSFLAARAPETTLRDSSGTPVITATGSAVKTAPANPGGLQVAGADQDVLAGSSGSGAANGQLAPGPETPAPDQLAAQTVPPQAPPVATAPAPVAPAVQPSAPPAPAAPAVVSHAPPAAVPAVTRVIPAPVAAEHPQATPAVAKSGGRVVQLGSLPSHAEAEKEWRRITAKMPALFSGHAPRIISVEVNGHTMYRLRTDGFANRDDAASFCAEVRDRHVRCELR